MTNYGKYRLDLPSKENEPKTKSKIMKFWIVMLPPLAEDQK